MLQRREGTIRYGCNCGCNTLWSSTGISLYTDCYLVFIILPLFHIYFGFHTSELVVKITVVIVVVGDLQAGKESGME